MVKHFTIVVEQDEDGVFLVECPQFKGCRSYGETIDEALANIKEAIELCLEDSVEEINKTVFIGIRDLELVV